ncbi:tRNA (adenosine(37)-N6)-threonylcarbamoyltransferase complex dimerization subunit type 1 TsaB [Paenibacillus sp. SC116]|uniref:tRNA (adenosine(37)-N6)-threonylcarbamoyltransferase complex dimerization subunit type 1 TsaB n=1 Tax=Paenibacillus sp. SC116 TaxID=2968986 RepID=UPI00215ACADA|nr:tRNA (adenosine(37)-N6)-threonylcarbamoyltransferase complex dimerization subunit type 1 TsaB [Paenibacillus sp. SC116]MCR8844149.1 tRNA (adenosine(37)-N6)-threonylcarbamoyltransferase complex dimerization subunit type 1 TsaB [Paenibacillus sp. SC116]
MHTKKMLALDTSTATMAAALLEGTSIINTIQSSEERNHSIRLNPTMQAMLTEQGWTGSQVDCIAVGIGPGSYTGVRISVTAAKTLAWAWRKPVVGVSSLHALALSGLAAAAQGEKMSAIVMENTDTNDSEFSFACQAPVRVYPIMDARRGQVYTAAFDINGQSKHVITGRLSIQEACTRLSADGIRMLVDIAAEAVQALENDPELHVMFAGDVDQHRAELEELQAVFGPRVHLESSAMDAAWIGVLGLARLLAGDTDEVHRLEPNYTQLTEAETKLKQQQQQVK